MEEKQPKKSANRKPRDLLEVLKVTSIQAAMDALCERCNGTEQPDFSGLVLGDYIDGMDLSAIRAENKGSKGYAWNDLYENNRIVLSGFNTFIHTGDTEVTKNHILFTFRHCPIRKRMNPTNDNTGGYSASELRAFLEGVNGDGTGDKAGVTTAAFLNALKGQIGDHILPVRKKVSNGVEGVWITCSLWIPTEYEIGGRSSEQPGHETEIRFPIYREDSDEYHNKDFKFDDIWYWQATPYANSGDNSCFAHIMDANENWAHNASKVGGCSPAFCIA